MRRDTEPGDGEPRDTERRRGAASRVAGHLHDRLRDAGMDAHADALADHVPAWEPAAPEEPTLAVVDHLETALGASAPVVPADVLRALGVLARDAPWRQTASYVACPPSDEFLDVYAHTTLLGPPDGERAGAARDGVALGLVLLGPGAVYPPHRHPADEIYLPLRSIEWTHERHGVPAVVAAGDLIHHLPWQPHSMRVGAGPALLLYLWSGDVTTPSRFCP